jgi:hypothetical protein
MTDHKEKRALKYGTTVYAAMIIIALAIGTFIYTLTTSGPEDIDDYVSNSVSPSDSMVPSGPPEVLQPTYPPPSE